MSWPSHLRFATGFAKDFALAALLALFVLVFLFQPFRVEGVSMLPKFADSDRIIVNKLSYRIGEIQRGDVVVFWFPEDPEKSFIKRVIGLPGDRVEIRGGAVLVNGEAIDEPYVPEDNRVDEDRPPVVVRRGYYYVLGDHRSRSFDSRLWGQVPERYIYGKVVFAYWPPSHLGFVAPCYERERPRSIEPPGGLAPRQPFEAVGIAHDPHPRALSRNLAHVPGVHPGQERAGFEPGSRQEAAP